MSFAHDVAVGIGAWIAGVGTGACFLSQNVPGVAASAATGISVIIVTDLVQRRTATTEAAIEVTVHSLSSTGSEVEPVRQSDLVH
jgi:hypothetical protein